MAPSDALVVKPFQYFDRGGECEFPTPDRIRGDSLEGKVTTLVLDANVCLHVFNYARARCQRIEW